MGSPQAVIYDADMGTTMLQAERATPRACPTCGAGRLDDVGPCETCGKRTGAEASPPSPVARRPTKKERRTARADDVVDLATRYAHTHSNALTRSEALRFVKDHIADLPNATLLRRGAAYALAAARAAPLEFYGGDGTPTIAKGEEVPEFLARSVRRLCDGGHVLKGKAGLWTDQNVSLGALLQFLASCDVDADADRGNYPLESLLRLWACLPEAVAREATKNAIDDAHNAVRKLRQQHVDLEGALTGAFGGPGDAKSDVRALEQGLEQAEALATELTTEDATTPAYQARLSDLMQRRRAASAAAEACGDALGKAVPTDGALDRWTAHRAAEKRLGACEGRRRALGVAARALHARAPSAKRRGLDVDALTRRVLDGVGDYDAMQASPRLDVVSLIRRIRAGEAKLPPAPEAVAAPSRLVTPRDSRLYDYAAARVACEAAADADAARTAKAARQRLRVARAAELAGALPANVDPDAAATVAHLLDRLAGRRRAAERPWERWAARAPPLDAAALGQLRHAHDDGDRDVAASTVEAVSGDAWRAALADAAAPAPGPAPAAFAPPPLPPAAAAAALYVFAGGSPAPADVLFAARRPRPRRRGAGAPPPRGKIVAEAAATGVAGLLAGARARAALCRAEAAVPAETPAEALPEAAAPPPAEAPGPAPALALLPKGTRVRYKDGALGAVAKCYHDDFPPYYDVALAGGRVAQCERGSLELLDRRVAIEAKLRRRAPKALRPALGAETVKAAGEALDKLPLTVVAAALEPRGRSALAIAAARNDANLVKALRARGAPAEKRDFAGKLAADGAPSTRVARACRFGAGEDAAPALELNRGRGPVRRVDWDVYVAGALRTARAYDLGSRELIFEDEAVPVEACDLRAGRSALDLYAPLRAQLENQRISSVAGELVDELAVEFVLGFRDHGKTLEREAAQAERCAMGAEERLTRAVLAAAARAARLGQLRLNIIAQETNFGLLFRALSLPAHHAAPACAPAPAPGGDDAVLAALEERVAALDDEAPVLADLERRVEALESDDEAPVLAAGHSPVEPALEESDPFGRLRRRGAGVDEPTSPDDPKPATGPKQLFAAGEQPTGAKRLGATEPAPFDVDAALEARFAKREATVRAFFLETTGSLAAYEHVGPDEGPERTERQRKRVRNCVEINQCVG